MWEWLMSPFVINNLGFIVLILCAFTGAVLALATLMIAVGSGVTLELKKSIKYYIEIIKKIFKRKKND